MKEAQRLALDLLLQYATEAGLSVHFQLGPSYMIPSSFLFVKNKSKEWLAELKWRSLFSHFHDPLKSLVGRALTVLIKAVVEVFDTWAILNTTQVREYAHHMQQILTSLFPDGIPYGKRPRLFELDVKEMFPRLPREGVLETAQKLSTELVRFLKENRLPPDSSLPSRQEGKKGLIFSVTTKTGNWTASAEDMPQNFTHCIFRTSSTTYPLISSVMFCSVLAAGQGDSIGVWRLEVRVRRKAPSCIAKAPSGTACTEKSCIAKAKHPAIASRTDFQGGRCPLTHTGIRL